MSEWEDKFNQETLDKGIEFYLNKKVVDLKETQTGYSAAILARKRHEVSVKMLASGVQSMSCKCPVARSGRNCEHMAALMYAIDAKKAAEESEQAEKILLEQWKQVEEELSQEKQRIQEEKEAEKEEIGGRKSRRRAQA